MSFVVIKRVLRQSFRERANYLYFFLLPLSLMVILGVILQGTFKTEVNSSHATVQVQAVVAPTVKGQAFKQALTKLDTDAIQFQSQSSISRGRTWLRHGKNRALVVIGQKAQVTTSVGFDDYQQAILKGYLASLFSQYQLRTVALKFNGRLVDPTKLGSVVKLDRQNLKQSATSYQYYAVAMIGMFMLYFGEVGLALFGTGRRQRTLQRELITPISQQQLINANLLGHLIYGWLVITALMLITQVLFKVPWQQAFIFSNLNLVALMGLFLSLGLFLETIGHKLGEGLMQVFIQLAAFLGGGYFPTSPLMMHFSPLGWVIGPLQSALWTRAPLDWSGVGLNIGLMLVLIVVTSVILRRREVF